MPDIPFMLRRERRDLDERYHLKVLVRLRPWRAKEAFVEAMKKSAFVIKDAAKLLDIHVNTFGKYVRKLDLNPLFAEAKRQWILDAMHASGWNQMKAADKMGVSWATFNKWVRQLGMKAELKGGRKKAVAEGWFEQRRQPKPPPPAPVQQRLVGGAILELEELK